VKSLAPPASLTGVELEDLQLDQVGLESKAAPGGASAASAAAPGSQNYSAINNVAPGTLAAKEDDIPDKATVIGANESEKAELIDIYRELEEDLNERKESLFEGFAVIPVNKSKNFYDGPYLELPPIEGNNDETLSPTLNNILSSTKKLVMDNIKAKVKAYRSMGGKIIDVGEALFKKAFPFGIGVAAAKTMRASAIFFSKKAKGVGSIRDKLKYVFIGIKKLLALRLSGFFEFYQTVIINLNMYYHIYNRIPPKPVRKASAGSGANSSAEDAVREAVRIQHKAEIGTGMQKMLETVVKETVYSLYRKGIKNYALYQFILDMLIPFEKYTVNYDNGIQDVFQEFEAGMREGVGTGVGDEVKGASAEGPSAEGGGIVKRKTYRKNKLQKRKYSKRNQR